MLSNTVGGESVSIEEDSLVRLWVLANTEVLAFDSLVKMVAQAGLRVGAVDAAVRGEDTSGFGDDDGVTGMFDWIVPHYVM